MSAALVFAVVPLVVVLEADAYGRTGFPGWRPASSGLPPQPNVLALGIESGPSPTLYAGLLARGIHRSTDGGRTWTSVTHFPVLAAERIMALPVSIVALATDPSRAGTVYAGTSAAGLLVTADRGSSWRLSSGGLRGRAFGELGLVFSVDALAIAHDGVRYAAVRARGVFRSDASVRRWKPTARVPSAELQALAVHPRRSSIVYAGTLDGVFKSRDGGRHWHAASQGLRHRLVRTLAVHPTRPRVLYAGTYEGVSKSVDAGRNWRSSSRGLGEVVVQDLLVDPRSPRVVYAATRGAGVFVTSDGGRSWVPMNLGLENRFVLALAFDALAGTLYAGTLGGVFSRSVPVIDRRRRRDPPTRPCRKPLTLRFLGKEARPNVYRRWLDETLSSRLGRELQSALEVGEGPRSDDARDNTVLRVEEDRGR